MRLAFKDIRLIASIVLVGVTLLVASAPVSAQPYAVPPTWGGDFWTRPRLTGDWGGLRDDLGKKGVVFDVDVLVTPMDVLSGGKSRVEPVHARRSGNRGDSRYFGGQSMRLWSNSQFHRCLRRFDARIPT